MKLIKSYLYKEYLDGIRTKKFLIIALGFIFFALADPVFLKLSPEILKNQLNGLDINSIIDISFDAAMKKFFQDLFQITSLVIIFVLMGIISNEISEKKFNIPFSINKKTNRVIISKLIIYSGFVFISIVISGLIAFYYSNLIFDDSLEIFIIIKSIILYSIFYIFLISIIMCFSTFFKRTMFTAVFSIFVLYIGPFITNISKIGKFIPANLLNIANEFNKEINFEMIYSVLVSILIIILVNFISCKKLSKIEM